MESSSAAADSASRAFEAEADRLRSQGNDAFSTKDWDRAVELYQQSVRKHESAKAYNNLATTFCKVSRFQDAGKAAERACSLDPTWAKAWWRRGVVAEMNKNFYEALNYYSIAANLVDSNSNNSNNNEKERTQYQKSLRDMEKRLKAKKTGPNGTYALEKNPNEIDSMEVFQTPFYKAWNRFREEYPESLYKGAYGRWCNRQAAKEGQKQNSSPTSQQYYIGGLNEWVNGMKCAVYHLVRVLSRDACVQLETLKRNLEQRRITNDTYTEQVETLMGGVGVAGTDSLQHLSNGFGLLLGQNLALECGPAAAAAGGGAGQQQTKNHLLCPPPVAFPSPAYQSLALCYSIANGHLDIIQRFRGGGGSGHDSRGAEAEMKSSPAVLEAAVTFFSNTRQPNELIKKAVSAATPQETVDFMKQQLQTGHQTWENGWLRQYSSVQYRGTCLYAGFLRLNGHISKCWEYENWAQEFIELADEEFKVSREKAYAEKGSCFRPSFRIGFMVSQIITHNTLRGNRVDGPYPLHESIQLCSDVIHMAKKVELPYSIDDPSLENRFYNEQMDVACRRKPLATARSLLASMLVELSHSQFTPDEYRWIAEQHGLVPEHGSPGDIYALIADSYRIAAEMELPDADQCAIFFWGYAANMCQASLDSGFTLGHLRSAISRAEAAECTRDINLFDPNLQRGGGYESQAMVTAEHYESKSDSFVLPQVKLNHDAGSNTTSLVVEDEIICSNFDERMKRDAEYRASRLGNDHAWMDASEIEKEQGADNDDSIPSLQTLCVRALHKAECEFAMGESDPTVIHYKAMMAAQNE